MEIGELKRFLEKKKDLIIIPEKRDTSQRKSPVSPRKNETHSCVTGFGCGTLKETTKSAGAPVHYTKWYIKHLHFKNLHTSSPVPQIILDYL